MNNPLKKIDPEPGYRQFVKKNLYKMMPLLIKWQFHYTIDIAVLQSLKLIEPIARFKPTPPPSPNDRRPFRSKVPWHLAALA